MPDEQGFLRDLLIRLLGEKGLEPPEEELPEPYGPMGNDFFASGKMQRYPARMSDIELGGVDADRFMLDRQAAIRRQLQGLPPARLRDIELPKR